MLGLTLLGSAGPAAAPSRLGLNAFLSQCLWTHGATSARGNLMPGAPGNSDHCRYGVFWLYNWFQAENNNMNIFFLMNGNIFNYSLASEQYSWSCGWGCSHKAYATPPRISLSLDRPSLSFLTSSSLSKRSWRDSLGSTEKSVGSTPDTRYHP